jgi:hypothetical protein
MLHNEIVILILDYVVFDYTPPPPKFVHTTVVESRIIPNTMPLRIRKAVPARTERYTRVVSTLVLPEPERSYPLLVWRLLHDVARFWELDSRQTGRLLSAHVDHPLVHRLINLHGKRSLEDGAIVLQYVDHTDKVCEVRYQFPGTKFRILDDSNPALHKPLSVEAGATPTLIPRGLV